jgi:ABC-2 type transport system permease protein
VCSPYALSSQIRTPDAAQPIVQAIVLPLYFVSGIFIPAVDVPSWLHDVARLFPVEHLADGLHHAYDPTVGAGGVVWSDLAVLALWAIAGVAIGLRRFSWNPATTTS